MSTIAPVLTFSRRVRSTPFTSRLLDAGVRGMTVYNHMLLPTAFRPGQEDYWHLCNYVQVWDVSVQRQVQIKGPDANTLMQWMTPRDISVLAPDQCAYVPLVDERGGLINDPVAIPLGENCWWLSISDSDVLLWAQGLAIGHGLNVEITEPDAWPVAVQGPLAETLMQRVFGDAVRHIRFFRHARLNFRDHEFVVARSGWSHQGGFEIYVDDAELGAALWDELFEQGEDLQVGHGCPNLTERVEAGLLSYGTDMDRRHSPLQCGLDRFCALDRPLACLGQQALLAERYEPAATRLMRVSVPWLLDAPADARLLVDESDGALADPWAHGELTSHCLSARYDAWTGFAWLPAWLADTDTSHKVWLMDGGEQHVVQVDALSRPLGELGLPERGIPEQVA